MNPLWRFHRSGFFNFLGISLGLLTLGMSGPAEAYGRRPPPVIHEAEFSGQAYLFLEDVAQTMNGSLHWYPVSQRMDLSFPSHSVQFFIGSRKVVTDGTKTQMAVPTVKDDHGVWVPKRYFQTGTLAKSFRRRIDLGKLEMEKQTIVISSTSVALPVTISTIRVSGSNNAKPKMLNMTPIAAPVVVSSAIETDEEESETAAPAEPVSIRHVIRRIVIDPGHGGKDPGAVGLRGTEEKSVNLWMAQELADALREKDFEVLLTRTDDSFIPLSQRAALANKYKADLFISLHCNASLSSQLNGFEVYILSHKASDPHADAVARSENASLEFEGKAPPPLPVQAVLRSLMKNTYINHSAQLGAMIERQVTHQMTQTDLGVKQAAFYVLRGADMPAILIEFGFLSNKSEERHLESKSYRKRLIHAIEAGILEYDRKQKA